MLVREECTSWSWESRLPITGGILAEIREWSRCMESSRCEHEALAFPLLCSYWGLDFSFPRVLCVHVSWGPSVVPECLHHYLNSLGQLPGRLLPNWFLPENPLFNKIIFRRATKQSKPSSLGGLCVHIHVGLGTWRETCIFRALYIPP